MINERIHKRSAALGWAMLSTGHKTLIKLPTASRHNVCHKLLDITLVLTFVSSIYADVGFTHVWCITLLL
jgi:hypothetical protein